MKPKSQNYWLYVDINLFQRTLLEKCIYTYEKETKYKNLSTIKSKYSLSSTLLSKNGIRFTNKLLTENWQMFYQQYAKRHVTDIFRSVFAHAYIALLCLCFLLSFPSHFEILLFPVLTLQVTLPCHPFDIQYLICFLICSLF